MKPLVRRMVLTEQTREKWYGRPFRWGRADCAKVAAFHARKFGWKVPKPGGYASFDGARERLAELGCETIPDLVSATGLVEIAPAFVLTGDIVSFACDGALGALGIALGNGNMLAFHEAAEGMAVVRMDRIDRAWSIWREGGA